MAMKKRFQTRSEAREVRKRRFVQVAVALFLVFLMTFSYIAFYFQPDPTTVRVNGFKLRAIVDGQGFVQAYTTEIDGKEQVFYASPDASSDIALPASFAQELQNAELVVVLFNASDNLTPIYDQVRFDFSEAFSASLLSAVVEPSASYPSLPVLNCESTTPGTVFLVLSQGPRAITLEQPGCYVISGSQFDYAFLRDRVVYRYLNITTA
jgi:hypothetical protein